MKLTLEQLKQIQTEGREINRPVRPAKFWSLDDLAKGRPFSGAFMEKVIKSANRRRWQHRHAGTRGWSKGKGLRSEVRIPTALYLQPEFQKKYFPEGADEHEKNKCLEQLKADYPIFVTHD